ncbi:STAS domain-containing protein [Pontibacter sp. JAM-7]|uniref:STAS domain-containing protein n=1 Tax=Pontibacter sp. JAM-7 TaxID=3366581 RepID=UPI003AF61D3B
MTVEMTLELPEEVSIENVCEWKEKFTEVLQGSSSVQVNAGALSRVDTAGIQLFAVAAMAAKAAGKPLSWQRPSDALKDTVAQLGLTQIVFN